MSTAPSTANSRTVKPSPLPNADKITSKKFLEEIKALTSYGKIDSLAGAYLFSGPVGVDKLSTALYIAKLCACLGTRDASCACRFCVSGFRTSPDVRLALLNEHGNLLSSTLTGLEAFFSSFPSTGAKRKVLVVENVDKVTNGTDTMLLKLLEDGIKSPDIAIFTTSNLSKVSLALRSRMTMVRFKGESCDEVEDRLGDSVAAIGVARASARMSLGSDTSYLSARKVLPQVFSGIMAGDSNRAWKACKPAFTGLDSGVVVAEVLRESFADLLESTSTGRQVSTINQGLALDITSNAEIWGPGVLASLVEDLGTLIRGRLPGQDLKSGIYRWLLKACAIASSREFKKVGAEEKVLAGITASGNVSAVTDDEIIIDFEG